MPQVNISAVRNVSRNQKMQKGVDRKGDSRFTVGLAPNVVQQVGKYARSTDSSMSKAIAALVRIGQEQRKRAFFKKLKANLAYDDPKQEDQLVDEFRDLIRGR